MTTPDIDALLERSLWDLFWLPSWARVIDTPSLLYTRSERDQNALNQVLRVRAAADLPARVDEVSAAHVGVTSRWLLARDSQLPGLPTLLGAGGWSEGPHHNVRWVDARAASLATPDGVEVRPVRDEESLVHTIRVAERAFGGAPSPIPPERVRDELAHLGVGRSGTPRVHRFVGWCDGAPVSSGGLNLFPALGLAFLWGGGTVPEARGRGVYRALVAARLEVAARLGCPLVAVYARHGTSDPIVAKLGFAKAGTMVVWERGPGG